MNRVLIYMIMSVSLLPSLEANGQRLDGEESIQAAASALKEKHFLQQGLNDELRARWFKLFIAEFDPDKLYFLQTDIDEFEKLIPDLRRMAKKGDVTFSRRVSERYKERVLDSWEVTQSLINTVPDFKIEEEMQRKYEDFAANETESTERWRLRIKYELLLEKSNGYAIEPSQAFLRQRYESIKDQALSIDDDRAVVIFIDTMSRSYDPHNEFFSPATMSNFTGKQWKHYRLGIAWRNLRGRKYILKTWWDVNDESLTTKIRGCELLAIRDRSGVPHNLRGIFKLNASDLIQEVLSLNETVTLELYDEVRMQRFKVECPRYVTFR